MACVVGSILAILKRMLTPVFRHMIVLGQLACSRPTDTCTNCQVQQFYTAPTAIRALMGAGNEWLKSTTRESLELLGTVGEPINPEAWKWYREAVGNKKCPIVDTWWQTETGGHMITSIPGLWEEKPGSATLPFFGTFHQLFIAVIRENDVMMISTENLGFRSFADLLVHFYLTAETAHLDSVDWVQELSLQLLMRKAKSFKVLQQACCV